MKTSGFVLVSAAAVLGLAACGEGQRAGNLVASQNTAAAARTNCALPQTTAEMLFCAQQAYEASDKRLNAIWPEVTNHFAQVDKTVGDYGQLPEGTTPSADLIVTAQLAWIDFRDNDCVARTSSLSNGSLRKVDLLGCKSDVTNTRTRELQQVLSEPASQPLAGSEEEFARIQSSLPECQDTSSNVQLKHCLGKVYEAADRLLNDAYRAVKAKLTDPRDIDALTTAELAWIRLRDSECTARVRSNWGGTGYSGFFSTCLASRTILRTTDLLTQFGRGVEGPAD